MKTSETVNFFLLLEFVVLKSLKKLFLLLLWSLNCNWNKLPSAKSLKECPCFIFAWRRTERKIKRGQNRKYFATSHNCSQHCQCAMFTVRLCGVFVCVCVCVKGKRGWSILYKRDTIIVWLWLNMFVRGTRNLSQVLFVLHFIYFYSSE